MTSLAVGFSQKIKSEDTGAVSIGELDVVRIVPNRTHRIDPKGFGFLERDYL